MRGAVELLHILAGLVATVAIAMTCSWAYPLGEQAIWLAAAIAGVATVLMGIEPLREAWDAERAGRRRN